MRRLCFKWMAASISCSTQVEASASSVSTSTTQLQPGERLWSVSNAPLVNTRPADLETLDTLRLDRCAVLQTPTELVDAMQPATHYHCWPAD